MTLLFLLDLIMLERASLREASQLFNNFVHKHIIINKINIERDGNENDLLDYFRTISKEDISGGRTTFTFDNSLTLDLSDIKRFWQNYKNGLNNLSHVFSKSLGTEDRLRSVNPPKNIKLSQESYNHPIHHLQANDELESKFSNYFKQAFGTDLIVHRNAGNEVPLYVGERPIPKKNEDRVSLNYIKEIEKLDLLHQQGDGMRSFVGVLLNAFISKHSVLFIDEPEAFLHPPQARLLGKMLAKDLPSERQLFLATHSEDFLKGLLDANTKNLKIIRLQRNGTINNASILDNIDINKIWNDSLLRHSNVLNGLFHSKVIICESDSDCRFFSALLSAQFDDTGSIAPDVLFIHCGGKHRMPTVIKALKNLNVNLKVISDFDLLNDINPLKQIFEDLEGDWKEVEKDWKLVKKEIELKRPEYLTEDVKTDINKILTETVDRIFPKEKISAIQKTLKKASPWTEAKEVGKPYIPSGNATQSFEKMQQKFKEKGLVILEVGELECFAKSIGNHGPKWVTEVLAKDLKNDTELEIARQFVLENIAK